MATEQRTQFYVGFVPKSDVGPQFDHIAAATSNVFEVTGQRANMRPALPHLG